MATVTATDLTQPAAEQTDRALAKALGFHFGDGLVYLPEGAGRSLLDAAVRLGLVSAEGYLTPAGRTLLARYPDF